MKAADIQVGGKYIAKVSGKLTTVRVDAIVNGGLRGKVIFYDVTNLATGRKTTFRSAAKFRSCVNAPLVDHTKVRDGKPFIDANDNVFF